MARQIPPKAIDHAVRDNLETTMAHVGWQRSQSIGHRVSRDGILPYQPRWAHLHHSGQMSAAVEAEWDCLADGGWSALCANRLDLKRVALQLIRVSNEIQGEQHVGDPILQQHIKAPWDSNGRRWLHKLHPSAQEALVV